MTKLMIRVKDKNKINELERYGSIVYTSPILNLVTLDTRIEYIEEIKLENNVISCEEEMTGRLMPV
ncbi:hypothetical protein [Niallia circulans]|uniref:hypothetical protein n=1 Tax=Niallia circulans TaxID=1397 RepID=UPI0035188A95